MADGDLEQPVQQDHTVGGAATAIEAWLKQPQAPQPEETSESAQSAAPPAEVANTEVEAEAIPSENTAPEIETQPAKPAPQSSQELETRLREADKSKLEADAARDRYLNQLNTNIPQLEASIRGKFADIKTMDDVYALMDPNSPKYDINRYNDFALHQLKLQQVQAEQQRVTQEVEKDKTERARKAWDEERDKLLKLMPELATDKGPAIAKKLQDFAIKIGISPERMATYTAAEFMGLHQAMQFNDLQAAQAAAKAKAASAPPVQKPGTARPSQGKDEKIRTDFERLQKTGHISDAARVFRNLMN